MLGLQPTIADADSIRCCKDGVALDYLDIATRHGAPKVVRNVFDQVLLAIDQGGPIELWLADGNLVNGRPFDFINACPAATSTFFGVQPRFGQVPPRSC